ncbi:MAG: class I SAM-dependent methyltransferase [Acidobacteria bacterium]|nr:class I SAM-dependent methyltransferase [Acidobacteriota bacterium]
MTRKEKWEQRYYNIQRHIVPELKYSQTTYEELLSEYIQADMDWLEAGCGHQILPEWRLAQEQTLVGKCRRVVGVDLDFEGIKKHRAIKETYYANLETLPFEAESFDLVTCNMVVEHLENPLTVFSQFHRVLRPGGKVIIHTPNAYGYPTIAARMIPQFARVKLAGILEGRPPEDVFPAHYRANTPRRLDEILSSAGFEKERFWCIPTACALYFSRILVSLELAYVRLTLTPTFENLRTNLLCVYTK